MAEPKAKPATIDEYIAAFPADVRATLQTLRQTIKEEAPGVSEAISYGIPTFKLRGSLVYFAAWKKHISLYPVSTAMEAEIAEMAVYKTSGKGTIQFPLDKPLPLPLVRKIVQFRLKEQATAKGK